MGVLEFPPSDQLAVLIDTEANLHVLANRAMPFNHQGGELFKHVGSEALLAVAERSDDAEVVGWATGWAAQGGSVEGIIAAHEPGEGDITLIGAAAEQSADEHMRRPLLHIRTQLNDREEIAEYGVTLGYTDDDGTPTDSIGSFALTTPDIEAMAAEGWEAVRPEAHAALALLLGRRAVRVIQAAYDPLQVRVQEEFERISSQPGRVLQWNRFGAGEIWIGRVDARNFPNPEIYGEGRRMVVMRQANQGELTFYTDHEFEAFRAGVVEDEFNF